MHLLSSSSSLPVVVAVPQCRILGGKYKQSPGRNSNRVSFFVAVVRFPLQQCCRRSFSCIDCNNFVTFNIRTPLADDSGRIQSISSCNDTNDDNDDEDISISSRPSLLSIVVIIVLLLLLLLSLSSHRISQNRSPRS